MITSHRHERARQNYDYNSRPGARAASVFPFRGTFSGWSGRPDSVAWSVADVWPSGSD